MLTAERARELLHYDPGTGVFTWLRRTSNRIRVGDVAGALVDGYIAIGIDGASYQAHRVAWLMTHGVFPGPELDHEDGNKSNNRIANLRDAGSRENRLNMPRRSDNSSGVTGVSWHAKARKWVAQVQIDGQNIYLGLHETIEAAAHARMLASKMLGFHENHGR